MKEKIEPKIRFSSDYPKLWGQRQAMLINVKVINSENLTQKLIEYDTKNTKGEYYKLPKGKLLHLTFIGIDLIPFCTIRRATPEKLGYYNKMINRLFEVKIEKVE